MKLTTFTKTLSRCMITLCIPLLSACAEESVVPAENIESTLPSAIAANFESNFPDAEETIWVYDDEYAIAAFKRISETNTKNAEKAWYCISSTSFIMHARNIPVDNIPEAVITAFRECDYASYHIYKANVIVRIIDDIRENIYVLFAKGGNEAGDIEKINLFFTSDGILADVYLEESEDDSMDNSFDYNDWLPGYPTEYIKTYIETNYPNAHYLFTHIGKETIKVKILDGRTPRQLTFNAKGEWISTVTTIKYSDAPEYVHQAIAESKYANCRIEKAEEHLTPISNYYLVTVKDIHGKKQEIRIDIQGIIGDPDYDNISDTDTDSYIDKNYIDVYLNERYPGAVITKKDYDDDGLEVKLEVSGKIITVEFELHPRGYVWISSEWKLNVSETPETIRAVVTEKYSEYQMYFLNYVESHSTGNYYEVGLKSTLKHDTIKVKFDTEGNVIAEYGKH